MTSAEQLAQKREEYRARQRQRHRRGQPKIFAVLAVFWAVLAAVLWLDGDSDGWLRWGWTVLAIHEGGLSLVAWRRVRRIRSEDGGAPDR